MAKYQVILDRPNCIGCGACVAACPENWEMQSDGKTLQKKEVIDEKEYGSNKEAAEVCPVSVINFKKMGDKSD